MKVKYIQNVLFCCAMVVFFCGIVTLGGCGNGNYPLDVTSIKKPSLYYRKDPCQLQPLTKDNGNPKKEADREAANMGCNQRNREQVYAWQERDRKLREKSN